MTFGITTLDSSAARLLALPLSCILTTCDGVEGDSMVHSEYPRSEAAPECPTPAPRWVLRDKDGARVPARVEPTCGDSDAPSMSECIPRSFGSKTPFPCVHVIDHGGNLVGVRYHLATGEILPCGAGVGGLYVDINEPFPWVSYLNAECTGERYVVGLDPLTYPEKRTLYLGDGGIWYISGQGCIDSGSAVHWEYDPMTSECTGPLYEGPLCPFRPVPEWVLTLLSNPPYTLEVEYE